MRKICTAEFIFNTEGIHRILYCEGVFGKKNNVFRNLEFRTVRELARKSKSLDGVIVSGAAVHLKRATIRTQPEAIGSFSSQFITQSSMIANEELTVMCKESTVTHLFQELTDQFLFPCNVCLAPFNFQFNPEDEKLTFRSWEVRISERRLSDLQKRDHLVSAANEFKYLELYSAALSRQADPTNSITFSELALNIERKNQAGSIKKTIAGFSVAWVIILALGCLSGIIEQNQHSKNSKEHNEIQQTLSEIDLYRSATDSIEKILAKTGASVNQRSALLIDKLFTILPPEITVLNIVFQSADSTKKLTMDARSPDLKEVREWIRNAANASPGCNPELLKLSQGKEGVAFSATFKVI